VQAPNIPDAWLLLFSNSEVHFVTKLLQIFMGKIFKQYHMRIVLQEFRKFLLALLGNWTLERAPRKRWI
jgi:hypothetical protein